MQTQSTQRIPVAQDAQDLAQKLSAFRKASSYRAESIPLTEVDKDKLLNDVDKTNRALWRMDRGDGFVGRLDGAFTALGGIRAFFKGKPGPSFDQIALYDSHAPSLPSGTVILVYEKGTGAVLADMRSDPGTDEAKNFITFGPTLQVSSSRIQQAQARGGDAALPLLGALVGLGAFNGPGTLVQQDPGRFFRKTNEVRAIGVESKEAFEAALERVFDEAAEAGKPVPRGTGLVWAHLKDFAAQMNRNELNEFFYQALGVLSAEQALEH